MKQICCLLHYPVGDVCCHWWWYKQFWSTIAFCDDCRDTNDDDADKVPFLTPTPRVFQLHCTAEESRESCSSSWCTFFFLLHMMFTSSSRCPVSTTSSSWILLQFSYLPACWSCVAAVNFFKLLASTISFVTKIAASEKQNLWKKKVVLTPWTVFLIWLFRNWVLL